MRLAQVKRMFGDVECVARDGEEERNEQVVGVREIPGRRRGHGSLSVVVRCCSSLV